MAKEKKICTRCGGSLPQTHFYKSNSELNLHSKHLSICKKCLIDIYDMYYEKFKNEEMSLYAICMNTDTYYDPKLVETSKGKFEESNMESIVIYYFSKINMIQYKNKRFIDSDLLDVWSKNKIEIEIEDKKETKKEITQEMINRWGKDRTYDDYLYLEERYEELISVYDHRMPTQRWSYETIVKTKLESEKALEREDYAMYDKLTDRVQKLMNDSNIKPIQQDNSDDLDANLPGIWAKRIQNDEPIPKAEGIFADPDKIGELFDRQFVKPMQKILGVGD